MFKKAERLNSSEFLEFFKSGTKHQFTHFTIITHPHTSLKTAVVVGKKVSKLAIKRNIFKRRVYNSLRLMLNNNNLKYAIIVILKPSYNTLPRKMANIEFQESFKQLLNKLNN